MPTQKQKAVIPKIVENHGNVSKSMREVGYTSASAKNPKTLTESKGYKELMEKHFPDKFLAKTHKGLLKSHGIGHMVFPKAVDDKEIKKLLRSANCKAKKIMHGETANHVWYWEPDNNARKSGLDMAYKLKGSYAATKNVTLNMSIEDLMAKNITDRNEK